MKTLAFLALASLVACATTDDAAIVPDDATHGDKADGNGAAAHLHDPRPANLTLSPYSDAYQENIIRDGGKALGRSAGMPPWGKQLSELEIKSVVAYLRTLKVGRVLQ